MTASLESRVTALESLARPVGWEDDRDAWRLRARSAQDKIDLERLYANQCLADKVDAERIATDALRYGLEECERERRQHSDSSVYYRADVAKMRTEIINNLEALLAVLAR